MLLERCILQEEAGVCHMGTMTSTTKTRFLGCVQVISMHSWNCTPDFYIVQ